MKDPLSLIEKSLQYLRYASSQKRFFFCIYDYSGVLRHEPFRSEDFIHRHPFCMHVKESKAAHTSCVASDHEKLKIVFKSGQASGVLSCHADVSEWVFPFAKDGRLMGGMFLGPFVTMKSRLRTKVPRLGEKEIQELKLLGEMIQIHFFQYLNDKNRTDKADTASLKEDPVVKLISANPLSRPFISPEMENLLEWLRGEFLSPISLSEVARRFQISPSRLSRKFKQEVGMNLSIYLQYLRLEYGKNLLRSTELPVVDIAARTGYGSVLGFIKAFKRKFSMTPGKFRNTNY